MTRPAHSYWTITLIAGGLLMVTMGSRQTMGLFVSPLNTSTGLGIAAISFAMAISQFVWGAAQPVAGALADRYGSGRVLAGGFILLALGNAMTPFMDSTWGLIVSIGLLSAIGAGAGSFSVLIGAVAGRLPADRRGFATGVINAGGSAGQFVFAPLLQRIITTFGWANALWVLSAIIVAVAPFTRMMRRQSVAARPAQASGALPLHPDKGLKAALRQALSDRSYLLLHAGFFTCGFHVAFLVTHLPGEVQHCGLSPEVASWSLSIIGLANIVGSLLSGWGVQNYRSKYILFWMYASRAILIILYLMAPKTPMTFYAFAVGLGLTWLATVPPTAGVVSKLFGTRYLGTLFGLTLLSHQTGAFFGAWLGGIAITETGSYDWMWYGDIVLAGIAAVFNLPIREAPVRPAAHPTG